MGRGALVIVDSAESARVFAACWIHDAPPERAARVLRRAANDQRACAGLCGTRLPVTRKGHEEAAAVLDEAADALEKQSA